MKIELDTRDRKLEKVTLSDNKSNKSHTTNKTYKNAFALLKAKVKDPSKISAVSFKDGSGSFTGLKVGAAIANALRYGLGLAGPAEVLVPEYGKKLNITDNRKTQNPKPKATTQKSKL